MVFRENGVLTCAVWVGVLPFKCGMKVACTADGSRAVSGEQKAPLTVLIVEDDVLLARSMMQYLRRHGIEADVCADGTRAVDRLACSEYDVLIADLGLPGVDGTRVICCAVERQKECRIVVISGDISPPVPALWPVDRCSFLGKPFDLDVLLAHVQGRWPSVPAGHLTGGPEFSGLREGCTG